ncbi:MAG: TatD family hydrolase [Patescibacteria group bacterium]
MFEYFDIHSHLYFSGFDKDREEEIEKMKEAKIGTISIGVDFATSQTCVEFADKYENLFACIGQHPGDITLDTVFDTRLEKLGNHPKVVAVGETGLDYFRMSPDDGVLKSIQKTIFEYHIDLALTLNKPLMLHIRSSKGTMDAYSDALDILEHHHRTSGGALKGNAHFFAGDTEVLKRFLSLGFTVSFTGVITFTKDYDELIKATPIDMLMSETDAPFVAPEPYRGQRNSPYYVDKVVARIAELKELSLEDTKSAILVNISRVFGIQ